MNNVFDIEEQIKKQSNIKEFNEMRMLESETGAYFCATFNKQGYPVKTIHSNLNNGQKMAMIKFLQDSLDL